MTAIQLPWQQFTENPDERDRCVVQDGEFGVHGVKHECRGDRPEVGRDHFPAERLMIKQHHQLPQRPRPPVDLRGTTKEGNVLFNDALNTFYLRLYGIRHMVKDHSDSEKVNPLPPHGLLFPISSKGSFIFTITQTG